MIKDDIINVENRIKVMVFLHKNRCLITSEKWIKSKKNQEFDKDMYRGISILRNNFSCRFGEI